MLTYARHDHIVPLLGVTVEPIQLVSEWMPNLRQHLKAHPGADPLHLVRLPFALLRRTTQYPHSHLAARRCRGFKLSTRT